MKNESLEEKVISLHGESKWQEIITLEREEESQSRRLLWVWPSLSDLRWIKNMTEKFQLRGIVSIGCGSGLLEWIIQQYSGIDVTGIETDKSWWLSRYSPPLFLKKMIFVDDEENIHLPENYGLLFCYFNNGPAFKNYMEYYAGNVIIIIGPDEGLYRTTDPLPFDEKLQRFGWNLRDWRKLDNGKDLATVYTR